MTTALQLAEQCLLWEPKNWTHPCSLVGSEQAIELARAVIALTAEIERMRAVVDAAFGWAESTREMPPNGDDDALNHLLEMAQNFYNRALAKAGGE